jgi:hypothetical protein
VAKALEIPLGHVEQIAAGKVGLAVTRWRKLGELVGSRMNWAMGRPTFMLELRAEPGVDGDGSGERSRAPAAETRPADPRPADTRSDAQRADVSAEMICSVKSRDEYTRELAKRFDQRRPDEVPWCPWWYRSPNASPGRRWVRKLSAPAKFLSGWLSASRKVIMIIIGPAALTPKFNAED